VRYGVRDLVRARWLSQITVQDDLRGRGYGGPAQRTLTTRDFTSREPGAPLASQKNERGDAWQQPPPDWESTWCPATDAKVCTVDLARMDAHDPMLPPWQFIYDCGHQDLFPEPRTPDEWQRLSTWLEQVWATPCATCAPFRRPADRLPIAARARRAIQLLVRRARR
jgi:hypothetical protein